jgi:hypothetical protein
MAGARSVEEGVPLTVMTEPESRVIADNGGNRGCMTKRELIEPHPGDKRYIRRDDQGRIVESDDVSRSLAADVKRSAKTKVKPGQGDRGDQKRS